MTDLELLEDELTTLNSLYDELVLKNSKLEGRVAELVAYIAILEARLRALGETPEMLQERMARLLEVLKGER